VTQPSHAPAVATPQSPPEPSLSALDWLGLLLVALSGALAALIETLLVPVYAGSAVVPVAVVLSLASNALLPRLGRAVVPRTFGALAPFLTWLIVVIGFGVLSRPEGDVILPGAPNAVEYVVYGVLLGGALVGTVTIVMLTPSPGTKRLSR
jgi:hypothetical protein